MWSTLQWKSHAVIIQVSEMGEKNIYDMIISNLLLTANSFWLYSTGANIDMAHERWSGRQGSSRQTDLIQAREDYTPALPVPLSLFKGTQEEVMKEVVEFYSPANHSFTDIFCLVGALIP